MRLKRLELQGYKTFAAKTEFVFEDGITAIVGPNGSGKSNIADAVRWVLGEQSYSLLRAKRTEDMIFWGSERRSRQGMAQASITLDNSDGGLPTEYNEVTISRHAYRSGENEYFLNGNRVRLKDISELLARCGLSRRTYTVIGQGLVDMVLSLRPSERRTIFEEAAGISIHQAKRNEAISKLDQTRDNILRVNDLINEIAPRLGRLEKQAERTQQYKDLSEQLEGLLRLWYGYRWQKAQAGLRQAEAKAREREELSQQRQAELEELERRKAELRSQQNQLRQRISDWRQKETTLQAQAQEKKRDLAVSQERLRLLGQQAADLAQEIESLEANRLAQLQRVTEAQAELGQHENRLQEQLAHLQEVQQQLDAHRVERQAVLRELSEAQDEAFQLATEAADRRNRLTQLSERREQVEQELEAHRQNLAEHQARLNALQEQVETLKAELEAIRAEGESLTIQRQQLEQASAASRERQAQLQAVLAKSEQEETRLQARYDLLEKMGDEQSGYDAGAEAVLQAARDGRLRGIIGPVASLIEVPAELETAIEAALGPHLHDIVVRTLADAEAAIQFLKRTKGGRATFLPLDSIIASERRIPPISAVKGVIGLAADLVKFERGSVGAGYHLLSGTIIVHDFDTALHLLPRLGTRGTFQIATLSGEVISSGGAITGGPWRGRGAGILARERERRELPQQLAEIRKRRLEWETQRQAEEANHRRLLEKLTVLDHRRDEIRAQEGTKLGELASQQRQIELLNQEMGWRRAIEDQLMAELRALDDKEAALNGELEALKEQEARSQAQIEDLQARAQALSVDELEARLSELRTSVAVAEQAHNNQRAVLQELEAGLAQLDEQVSVKQAKMERLAVESDDLVAHIEDLQHGYMELTDEVSTVAELLEPAEAQLAAWQKDQLEVEEAESRLRPLLREYESLQGQAMLELQRRKDELTSLAEQIENDLGPVETDEIGPTLPAIEELPPRLEKDIARLRARIRDMGPINPNAPAEYNEVVERYDFLTTQAADLEEAATDLRQVIGELDELMERDFRETFEAVRKEFKKYFVSLFGGGTADLVLTEPDELMEAGVEIIARPPGRREQTLAMLSGGERALTAVALIFAILKVSPTPFCFLDEVDATLDEANVGRFREALQELSEHTQFIIISHNRGTVEVANTIYGISMGEDSTSRVISLKLSDQ